jgi:glycosyltransferase involved in cell wall biosynthesis
MARRDHGDRRCPVLQVLRLSIVTLPFPETSDRDSREAPVRDAPDGASAPLEILGVDPEIDFAGGESQVLGLTLELIRAGHRAELACDPRGELWRRADDAGVTCHPLAIRNALDFGAGLRLRSLLHRRRFDVVHFHTARAHSLAPFARGLAGALIVTRRMDYRPNRLFASYLYNRAVDGVAAISSGVADALTRAGVASERIVLIPSGVDCERFGPPSPSERDEARDALGLGAGDIAIGTVGALEPRKGHRYLLQAIAELARSRAGIRCFIAGDGSARPALQADIRRLGLEPAAHLMGRMHDPRTLLWALDIFALPSLKEGLGVALLEAMACGLAVVGSNVGGIADAIEDRRSGILVAAGNSSDLAVALGTLAENRDLRAAFGAAARKRVEERFGMAAMARQTLSLYRSCLAGGRKIEEK